MQRVDLRGSETLGNLGEARCQEVGCQIARDNAEKLCLSHKADEPEVSGGLALVHVIMPPLTGVP